MNSSRNLDWMSSSSGSLGVLEKLNDRLHMFYANQSGRELYQKMLSSQEEAPLEPLSPGDRLLNCLLQQHTGCVLEVGCANGWLYRHLRSRGFGGAYAGLEMADYIIAANRVRHPEARWETGTAYSLPFADGSIDACFAFYVLEHLVFPERALTEMLRVVRPGGRCFLAFPDFAHLGFLPSQLTGFSPGSSREKLAAGRVWDALVTLYDSRFRVRPAIRAVASRFGPFPVNTRPLCLDYPELMWSDIDAIYIASKDEVAAWARGRGLEVDFPAGRDGEFATHAFFSICKPKY